MDRGQCSCLSSGLHHLMTVRDQFLSWIRRVHRLETFAISTSKFNSSVVVVTPKLSFLLLSLWRFFFSYVYAAPLKLQLHTFIVFFNKWIVPLLEKIWSDYLRIWWNLAYLLGLIRMHYIPNLTSPWPLVEEQWDSIFGHKANLENFQQT